MPLLFTLVCVVGIIATWRSFGGDLPLGARDYRVGLVVPDAGNLQEGGEVRVAGVGIGKVHTVVAGTRGAEVEIDIEPRFAPLHRGTTAIVRSKSLLGEAYLELRLGPPSAPAYAEGAELPASAVRPNQQLADVVSTFEPKTRDDVRGLFRDLSTAVDDRSQEISTALGRAPGVTRALDQALREIDAQREQLDEVVGGTADVLDALGSDAGAVRSAVVNGRRFLDATAARSEELSRLVRVMPRFLAALDRTSVRISAVAPDIRRAATALRRVARVAPPALLEIDRTAPIVQRLFAGLPGLSSSIVAGTPSLTRLLRTSPTPFAQIYDMSRELIPFLQLAAADRREITGVFANVGSVLSGKSQLGDGRIVNYGSGLPVIWNEIAAGWVRRLPTNRLNPYPRPGGAETIATGGLKAFDCRNTDNVPYLAATGSGAPPCLEQEPWTFNGTTAQYPRLQLDPP
ncbi:MlaD family protein [Paraconexibacter algicola]|uniref:MlaD family protein n=1 Tax=Paraconexibacter algicola TaxID=2133960 RepID=UPI001304AAD4|nr:MlaD family protein [Paraconexibacter algicola]